MTEKTISPPHQQRDRAGTDNAATGIKRIDSSRRLHSPAMYALVMLNDDVTPMSFVVEALVKFIRMSPDLAAATMLKIHHSGEARCGVYTRDIGETKVAHIHDYARDHDYPLRCILRKTQR